MDEKYEIKIIVNGNCMLCGKELKGDEIFFCKKCEKKGEVEQ